MNKLYLAFVIFIASSTLVLGQSTPIQDSLSMGPGYANDLFYSMENGLVSTAPRNNWDIAFYTDIFSAGILVNDSYGEMLYAYPKGDTSSWGQMDTTGISTWTPLHNSSTVWEDGAFNANAKGHPDYGWCVYNSVNHNLYGDSLFILYIPEIGYKKVWIKEKLSLDNIYIFQYADLDGSDLQQVQLDIKPYATKRFAYYSLSTNEAIDREPASDSWDILFTKYIDKVPDGNGGFAPYPVTGATINVGTKANHFYPVDESFNAWASKAMDSTKNIIGYDWKSFDMSTFTWTLTDSNYYFIRNYNDNIYRLRFIAWTGSSTGDFVLEKKLVSLSSVFEQNIEQNLLTIFPNPASNHFTVRGASDIQGEINLTVSDQTGRQVFQKQVDGSLLKNGIRSGNFNLPQGIYFVRISSENYRGVAKLILR